MVQWLGVLFCNRNSLKPSISTHAKTNLTLATPRLLAPAVLHCEHIVERKISLRVMNKIYQLKEMN